MARHKHNNSRSSLAVGLVAVLATFLAGCGLVHVGSDTDAEGLPTGPVSAAFVKARPEAQLVYPGATLVAPFGGDERSNFPDSGKSSAFTGGVFSSPDSPQQIYAWYRQQLQPRGWQDARYPLANTQISLQGYARGQREKLYVAVDDPRSLARTLGREVGSGGTVFEFRYLIGSYSQTSN